MEIKEAIEHIKNNVSFVENTDNIFRQNAKERKATLALFTIIEALNNGYTLCKVDEAKHNMKSLIKKYADNPIYDERIEAAYECLDILKEACEC